MVVLDTDHASELGFRSATGLRLLERLTATGGDAVITAITVEEQLRGWLAQIHRASHPAKQIAAYDCLVRQIEFLALWVILAWDAAAVEAFQRLRRGRVRIGTQDLKIASITLTHDAILLTRNVQDFDQVPGLKVENWLD